MGIHPIWGRQVIEAPVKRERAIQRHRRESSGSCALKLMEKKGSEEKG